MSSGASGSHQSLNKSQILDQLKKEGVTNLDQFADFLLKKAHPGGDTNKPIANAVIVYNHGFVNH